MSRRGISLIEVIIAIIVLVILAAKVVMLAVGENATIEREKSALEASNKAIATEKVLLAITDIKIKALPSGQTVAEYLYDETDGTKRRRELAQKEIHISPTIPTEQELAFTIGEYVVLTNIYGDILHTKNSKDTIVQPQEANVNIVSTPDGIGTEVLERTQVNGTPTYISFEAIQEGGTITNVTYDGEPIALQGNKYVQQVTSNGSYDFTIIGTVGEETTSKTFTVSVNQYIVVLGEPENSERYGDKISYNVSLAPKSGSEQTTNHLGNGWKIFYEDSAYLYIIAEDYLHNTRLPNGEGKLNISQLSGYPYAAFWSSTANFTHAGAGNINTAKANQFGLSWIINNAESINNNVKVVADLFDESWTTEFGKGIDEIICTAIGGPTIEMYVKSWNAKGYTKLYCNNSNAKGYYIGTKDNPKTTYIDMHTCEGYNDKLYYPRHDKLDNNYGYWIASPSAYTSTNVMNISYNGYIGVNTFTNITVGIRPVVSILKANIELIKSDGIWNITKI